MRPGGGSPVSQAAGTPCVCHCFATLCSTRLELGYCRPGLTPMQADCIYSRLPAGRWNPASVRVLMDCSGMCSHQDLFLRPVHQQLAPSKHTCASSAAQSLLRGTHLAEQQQTHLTTLLDRQPPGRSSAILLHRNQNHAEQGSKEHTQQSALGLTQCQPKTCSRNFDS